MKDAEQTTEVEQQVEEFVVFQGYTNDNLYTACLIEDVAGCCTQGLEFILDNGAAYPEDYPELNTQVTVIGVFDTYEEDGYVYCHLVDAYLES